VSGVAVWAPAADQRASSERSYTLTRGAQEMLTAMLDQETGLRGYILTADRRFLGPYREGRAKKATASTARPAAPRSWKAKASRGPVVLTLPKLGKGQRFEIMRATKTKYGWIATTTRRSYTDRKVRRGRTYRYRVVLVGANGVRSLPSKTIVVGVR